MLAYPVLSYKERLSLCAGASLFGVVLGLGFIPAAQSLLLPTLHKTLGSSHPDWVRFLPLLPFPALAIFFHLSMYSLKLQDSKPWSSKPWSSKPWSPPAWKATPVALACAFLFGMLLGDAPSGSTLSKAWLLLAIPVGEEFLFRGWLWKFSRRVFGARLFSFTNPLPAAVIAVSLAFAFWHVQNLRTTPVMLTLWQMTYSFFASIWLCAVRERPGAGGGLAGALVAHAALNAATLLGQRCSWY